MRYLILLADIELPFPELSIGLFPSSGFVFFNGQAIDAEVVGDSIDHVDRPVHVRDECEDKIEPEIEDFKPCVDHRKANSW